MVYIRAKKVKSDQYLYLVKSVWDSKKSTSKQEIVKYLGKASEVIKDDIPEKFRNDPKILSVLASYNPEDIKKREDATKKSKIGEEFIQLTGNDDNAFEFNKRGGVGTISVTANIAPKLCSDFQKFSKSSNPNEFKEAEKLNELLQPLHKALFIESNPSPVKYVCKLMGLCDDAVRLPLVRCREETKKILEEVLKKVKLI